MCCILINVGLLVESTSVLNKMALKCSKNHANYFRHVEDVQLNILTSFFCIGTELQQKNSRKSCGVKVSRLLALNECNFGFFLLDPVHFISFKSLSKSNLVHVACM